ncbi:hypothetical protein OEZ86_009524 [Tetradesmus obliquus]|uniref:Uncharacterized protein n=1 Tax=Tetradesmus obliquus TaxID=3088 RepID=A0ABY8UQG6_TETOB|nr:hypothetical protein OEZ85_000970 [Tetradesmus obliquus]WIA42986.1 hypothetical protein OEZ86_009524 [Tetradesmus obliquus]
MAKQFTPEWDMFTEYVRGDKVCVVFTDHYDHYECSGSNKNKRPHCHSSSLHWLFMDGFKPSANPKNTTDAVQDDPVATK